MPEKSYSATINVNGDPAKVWAALTDQGLIPQWMGDAEMNIRVNTSWKIGSPIIISGFYHTLFENKGTVLRYDEPKHLSYTHLSSVSELDDQPANYSIIQFLLKPELGQTVLTINIENFPSPIIRKHLEFYWRTTLFTIKDFVEKGNSLAD